MTTTSRDLKNTVYEHLARLGKALSSGPRVELLDLLAQGPRTVDDLAQQVGQSVANTSQHLQVLRRARLVEAEKRGLHAVYRLAHPDVQAFFGAFRRLAEDRLLEIQDATRRFLAERDALEPVDADRLVARIRAGEVTLLDVRPPEEFAAGHLPGALSVPVADLADRLATLPRDREVVAYCRGPYCVMALDAVQLLRAHGFRALRLDEGVTDWRARGLPITTALQPHP